MSARPRYAWEKGVFMSGLVTFTPTVTFATPGDLAVTYPSQIGLYDIVDKICHISLRLQFILTYTTTVGAFSILANIPPPQSTAISSGLNSVAQGPIWTAGDIITPFPFNGPPMSIFFKKNTSGTFTGPNWDVTNLPSSPSTYVFNINGAYLIQ